MKIVKYVFLLLLLTVIAITVFIATQEGKYDIQKERVIKVPQRVLYNYIGEYKNWENVGIITDADTTAVYTYSENTFGKGASMSWEKDGIQGKINTVKVIENDSIFQKATIDGLDSEIAWGFKDTIGGTKITVRMKGKLSFKEKAYAVLRGDVNEKMEAALSNGLENLNTFLVHELGDYNVEIKGIVIKTGVFYLGQPVTSKMTDLQKKAGEIFPKLTSFIKTNKIAKDGDSFILYKTFSMQKDSASYVICIPIKEEIHTAPGSEYVGGKIVAFRALKTTLKGDYSHLPKAWDAAQKHVRENALQDNITGQYIEIYSTGIQQTKKPSQWITDIYIPIGAPAIIPETESILMPPTITTTVPAGTVRPVGTTPVNRTTQPTAAKPTSTTSSPAPATNKPAGNKPKDTTKQTAKPKPTQSIMPVQQPGQ